MSDSLAKSGVWLLLGSDNVSKEAFLEKWTNESVLPEARCFDLDIIFGGEFSGEEIVSRALSLPMMSPMRTVIVKQAQRMNAADTAAIAEYSRAPSSATRFLLEAESVDKRQKSWKIISKAATIEEFNVPYPDKIPAWIVAHCRNKYKRNIDIIAARLLCDCVGNNLAEIEGELNKLDIFVDSGKPITLEAVRSLVGARADDVFKLLSAIGEKRRGDALRILESLMQTDNNPTGHLAMITRHFFILLCIAQKQYEGLNEKDIAAELKLNTYFHFNKLGFGKQAQNFGISKIEKCLEKNLEAERNLKTGQGDPKLIMDTLIFDICKNDKPVIRSQTNR